MNPPQILHAPAWTKKDGRTPYHYQNKPAGNRCMWSCTWVVAGEELTQGSIILRAGGDPVMVTIREWHMDPDSMDDVQLLCELEDISARPSTFAWKAAQLTLDYKAMDNNRWRIEAIETVTRAREGYERYVYLAPWKEPTKFHMRPPYRPGWEK